MIRFIEDPSQRQGIARQILESLVRWFEVEESREDYIRKAASWPFWAAFCDEKPVGFLCVKPENEVAKKLYRSFGFVEADRLPEGWDQIPAILKL